MLYFIVNPSAGGGRGLRVWNATEAYLNKRHFQYRVSFTSASGDAKRMAQELTETCREERCIIAVGGDGTINEVADGLSFSCPVVLGFLPAGSGNDLGRGMGLPAGTKRLLEHLFDKGEVRSYDYGVMSCGCTECRNRRFLVSSGIGFDAAVCQTLLSSRKSMGGRGIRVGKLSYLLAGIYEFLRAKPVRGYLLLDGTKKIEFNHILFISVHIHPSEGGGFQFAPQADPQDGKLAICVMSSKNKFRLIPTLLDARRRFSGACRGVRFYECREAHIHTEQPLAVHTDGEACRRQTDIDVRCVEKQLRMLS